MRTTPPGSADSDLPAEVLWSAPTDGGTWDLAGIWRWSADPRSYRDPTSVVGPEADLVLVGLQGHYYVAVPSAAADGLVETFAGLAHAFGSDLAITTNDPNTWPRG